MLHYFIEFSVKNKLIVGLFTIALILWGGYSVTQLPIDAVPDITNNQVLVLTTTPSLAAQEVERLITYPIEQAMLNIPGLIELRSFSRFGLSNITIVFDDDVDVYWARQQVSERLNQVKSQIPSDAGEPVMGPVTTGLGEIFQYVVRPKVGYEHQYSLTDLRTIQDWIVRKQLVGTPGVADVSSFGGSVKQYEIALQPERLKSMGVTTADVFEALQQNNQNTGGSYIEKGPTVLFIRSEGLVGTIADIEQIVVKNTQNGIPVLIKDVANVQMGTATRYGATTYNDQGEVAGAIVMMLKGENSSRVIQRVKARIAEIEKTLPEGIMIEPFLDRTKMVNNAIKTVSKNLIEGALIVIGVLILFLGNLRAGLVVASVIPLAMLFAVAMMNLFGVSGNLMSLGAIDFGLIVDGAVIIVEAVMHHLGLRKSTQILTQNEMDTEVVKVSSRIRNAAAFGEIIILIVYLPILFLVGIEGKMFSPMAQTVAFCIMGAFILSLTYVPMMSSLMLSKKNQTRPTVSDRLMAHLLLGYERLFGKAIQYPKITVGVTLLAFLAAIGIFNQLGGEFIPELEEGDFAVDTRVLTGSSLPVTIEATQKAAGLLMRRFPEVEKVVTKIGSGEIPTDPMPIEASDMMVILKERAEWTSARTFEEMANKMSAVMQEVPGITAGFQYPVQMRFNELMTGARQDIVCKIFGENLDTLSKYASQLGKVVEQVEGAKDLYVEQVTGMPQIVVHYDRAALARYGLHIADVNRVIRTAFAGETAGLVYEEEKRYDLVVRLDRSLRQDIHNVQQLLLPTASGTIPLSEVADVSLQEGPNQIQREFGKRRIIVGFNVRGRDVESIVNELATKTATAIRLPPGYSVSYGGQFENLNAAKARLLIVVPLSLLLILVLLYFAFGQIRHGLLIFSSIPLSAIGGIAALWLRGMPFSISAGVGFIALFGVSVLNGIVLVTEFNHLRASTQLSLLEIVKKGTAVRLRPVLMTAAVASLGFLPMALSFSAGSEVQRPLATVVIGGLVSATLLTLIVLPILYVWLENWRFTLPKTSLSVLVGLMISICGMAQTTSTTQRISLDDAVGQALQQNLSIQQTLSEAEREKVLIRASRAIPKTNFNVESGSFNSAYFDTRLSVGQSFAWPKVYRGLQQLQTAVTTGSEQRVRLRKWELVRQVKMQYYEVVWAQQRYTLLTQLDSVYQDAVRSASLRLKTGESSPLELTAAKSKQGQLQQAIRQQTHQIRIAQERLSILLHSSALLTPSTQTLPKVMALPLDSSLIAQHPALALLKQEVAIKEQYLEAQRNTRLPEWGIGYNNQSLRGYQRINSSERFYGGWYRFSSFQVGIAIPIFGKNAYAAKEKAAQLDQQATQMALQQAQRQLNSDFNVLIQSYLSAQSNVAFYETTARLQANQLLHDSQLSLRNGEISYLEWVVLMNEVFDLRQQELEARWALAQTLIDLESLLTSTNE